MSLAPVTVTGVALVPFTNAGTGGISYPVVLGTTSASGIKRCFHSVDIAASSVGMSADVYNLQQEVTAHYFTTTSATALTADLLGTFLGTEADLLPNKTAGAGCQYVGSRRVNFTGTSTNMTQQATGAVNQYAVSYAFSFEQDFVGLDFDGTVAAAARKNVQVVLVSRNFMNLTYSSCQHFASTIVNSTI